MSIILLAGLLSVLVVATTLPAFKRGTARGDRPRNHLERVFFGLALALVSIPLAYFATILAFPLWSLIERTTGIEAMGRHFPSEWCFVATYAVVLVWLRFVWSKQRQ
jgi:hypothetical protein